MVGAAIGKVVAGNGGNDDMPETQATSGLGHAIRFVGFQCVRSGRGDCAKAARAGAAVASNHEGGGALAPAFPMVRAAGALTNSVELEFVQQRARARETFTRRQS